MLVTAAPPTRKQVSAMMVIAFDKPFSVPGDAGLNGPETGVN
jgi:hypothetical protein